MTKVAKLYYEARMRQPEIAERLGLSQSRVSRLVREAHDHGIVRTVVLSPKGLRSDLEAEMIARFDLLDAVVAEPASTDDYAVMSAVGSAGATYLEATLNSSDRVGVSSWSSTLLAAVNLMVPRPRSPMAGAVVQVIGGVGRPDVQVQANRLAERLAQVAGAEPKFFPTPGLVGSRQTRDAMMTDRYLAGVTDEWRGITTLLAGIGTVRPSSLLASSGAAVDDHDVAELTGLGAVGDICLRFFDAQGAAVRSSIDERVLGIDSTQLLGIPRRIAMAVGHRKVEAIRGALLGGWANIMITDVATAREVLGD
ncbi:MarR family transcriptional regulator [Pseudactinotalea sp. HY160]|nr:sugar-binding domain-containing protein [Pseudactinotalea sp. HY160]MPV51001.1 MarR family transcriptional regulator [Pseudactinotalea sp. HY160]QGH71011.1 MarR family transcriptional regulator [Pseudactinotalea sp. HY158]